MTPIHKFNSGRGATLCNECRCTIAEAWVDKLICDQCAKTHIVDDTNSVSSWNYRVIRTEDGDEPWYAIHEVYYDDNHAVDGYTLRPVTVSGNSIDDLRWTLEQMLKSLDKEVIEEEEE